LNCSQDFGATRGLQSEIKKTKWSFEVISIHLVVSSPKKYMARRIFATLVSLLLALSAFAQGNSSLWGKVTDATGAPVSGATIVIKNLETDTERTRGRSVQRRSLAGWPVRNYGYQNWLSNGPSSRHRPDRR
jgi:hypothetical protein